LGLLLSLIAGVVGLASANPISMPLVVVDSPQNNQIYPTTHVQLKFGLSPYAYYNFSSFAYSLDGQPTKATDGNTVLTDLAAGSHTLIIYGNSTHQNDYNSYNTHNDMVLAIVYFSIVYSTAWITFGLTLFAAFSVTSLVLFTNRRQLVNRFKAKKTLSFWFGLTCFLFASLLFIANGWGMASNYLFPYYPHRLEVILFSPVLVFAGGIVFMGLGVGMMALGTKERKGLLKK